MKEDYDLFYTTDMDVALEADFAYQFPDDKENYYVETFFRDHIKVSKDIVQKLKK